MLWSDYFENQNVFPFTKDTANSSVTTYATSGQDLYCHGWAVWDDYGVVKVTHTKCRSWRHSTQVLDFLEFIRWIGISGTNLCMPLRLQSLPRIAKCSSARTKRPEASYPVPKLGGGRWRSRQGFLHLSPVRAVIGCLPHSLKGQISDLIDLLLMKQ